VVFFTHLKFQVVFYYELLKEWKCKQKPWLFYKLLNPLNSSMTRNYV
jgi:hypothetical protein